MRSSKGLTLLEVLLGVAALGIALWVLAYAVTTAARRDREEARRIRCRGNLNQLAKGMATYLNEYGDNRFYPWPAGLPGCGTVDKPNFGGAEWLASLYWTKVIPDPGCFLCPSSPDTNENGALLGSNGCPGGKPLSPHAVSYAAFGDNSVGIYVKSKNSVGIYLKSKMGRGASNAASKLAIRDDFPPNEAMASDDTQPPINHGEARDGGMSVLFFDSHVEYWTHTRIDLERGVGMNGSLDFLRN